MTRESIAVLGTGLTGAPLATHLASSYRVVAWDRDRSKVEPLEAIGVVSAESARQAVTETRRVIIDLFDDEALETVSSGENGLLAGIEPGTLVIDLSTTSLETKLWLGRELAELEANLAEAPFFGSVAEIGVGRIWTVVGCEERIWSDTRDFLNAFSTPTRVGELGQATRFKLAANVLTFSMVELIAEAITLARTLDFDPDRLLDVISDKTGVRAPIYQVKGRAMIDGDYAPRATIDLARKDLDLILDAAHRNGLNLPLAEAAKRRFDEAAALGWSHSDMARVFELFDRKSDG